MAFFSLTVPDVCDPNDGGGAGHRHLPATAGDLFRGDPLILENLDQPFSDSFGKTLFAKTATHSA